jgi:hypothetical protein
MTKETFIKLYHETEENASLVKDVIRGFNYEIGRCGGGVYTRHMWDIDTGEIYKYQIIVYIAPERLLITEWCALDGDDEVRVWYENNTKMIKG